MRNGRGERRRCGLAGGRIIKAEEEVDERAFAGAAFAGETEALAASKDEADVMQHGGIAVGEGDVA